MAGSSHFPPLHPSRRVIILADGRVTVQDGSFCP